MVSVCRSADLSPFGTAFPADISRRLSRLTLGAVQMNVVPILSRKCDYERSFRESIYLYLANQLYVASPVFRAFMYLRERRQQRSTEGDVGQDKRRCILNI